MANKSASKKSIKQDAKRNASNRSYKTRLKNLKKVFLKSLESGIETAKEAFIKAQSLVSSLGRKKVIHANKASRLISRMAHKLKSSQVMPNTANSYWQAISSSLAKILGQDAFNDWFLHAQFIEIETAGKVSYKLLFPTSFVLNWVQNHYEPVIQKIALNNIKSTLELGLLENEIKDNEELEEITTDFNTTSLSYKTKFKSSFTFSTFMVDKSNEIAYNAALRIAESKKIVFNPFFVWGGVGRGKTHLMHAIAQHMNKIQPKKKILYLSAEEFMNTFIKALKQSNMMLFKEEFRSVDCLIIDDFQFLGRKEATQEEFFHTFNALIDQKKQLIICADKPPSSIAGIEERLRSRLGWGLIVDIHRATYELRLSILREKSKKFQEIISEEVLVFLAENIKDSIRELEGGLIRVITYAQLMSVTLSVELAEKVLKNITPQHKLEPNKIIEQVSNECNITIMDILSKSRKREIVRARQKAIYLIRKLTTYSYPQIGVLFGGKDHTSIMYAEKKANELMKTDGLFFKEVNSINDILK